MALPAPNANWRNIPPRKQLTQKELEEKRAKNLCFYCDQKYSLGHKCPSQKFSLEVVVDKDEPEEKEEVVFGCLEEENASSELESEMVPQISLHAFNGVQSYQTMRVVGKVGNMSDIY